ncbi:protein adenylyltransferase SelO family protein [Aliiglaciecola sp. CAU 1673]|uniref:protein adenylyltransferase SelO n=1 Tax=Aliiglaciecola sp. CAU 1673 TaxID=3032595 RepID=UPI0023DC494F|nr:protein adenylyltransferase SelO family protein [Aliiglaciecola sp. CAU 1673]MDF2178583.1 protein adenylyltransferase SelO family protein [Aliiglaciecola sp. CAU 1673]
MTTKLPNKTPKAVETLSDLAQLVDYSLMDTLTPDPDAKEAGEDYRPRQVFSGHYVPVKPTPIANPRYVAHSKTFFRELDFDDGLAQTEEFKRLFSGDLSQVPPPMHKVGWATGYALSIYGTEYIHQCPFHTGNGYGDGRAISVVEAVINGKRWEMQLKGAGRTPYCRGADGRAVLRSSVREFLAQEHMHALGVPTSRSLCLFVSQSERVDRPWYLPGSDSFEPEIMVSNPVAISTRVAPSFLRVGQLELFGRRARSNQHPNALQELEAIVLHLIEREYSAEIDRSLTMPDQFIQLAMAFRERLTSLVANWIRVGYCQGNFNSDNCAGGGFTLDYGPFGFCELFEPMFQPWTGGGRHFSFLNQPMAAQKNFEMFCRALMPLLSQHPSKMEELNSICSGFATVMEDKMEDMWASKLGLEVFDAERVTQLLQLMVRTNVDYTVFFRELSALPSDITGISKSFYSPPTEDVCNDWQQWLTSWREQISKQGDRDETSAKMKQVNPKFSWREWLIVPAYQQAEQGNYALIEELQAVLTKPYDEQSPEMENKYYRLRPAEFFDAGGIAHYSCSS